MTLAYVIGAVSWAFIAMVGYGFASGKDRRWLARAFFAFPIWPAALGALAVIAAVKLWKSAEWRA